MAKLGTWGLAVVVACVASACGDDSPVGGSGGSGGSGGNGAGGSGGADGGSPPTSGGGGEGGTGGSMQTPCEAICAFQQGLEDEIMCGYDGSGCVGDCEGAFSQLPEDCLDEAVGYNDCLMAQPIESFTCTDGVFTLTTGECTDEFDAYAACL